LALGLRFFVFGKEGGMALPTVRLYFVALLAFAACQIGGDSKARSASRASESGMAIAAPSVMPAPSRSTAGRSQAKQQHFIEFRSRYAYTYGHAFVIFGRLSKTGQMIAPQVAGLAPKSNDPNVYVLGHAMPVPSSTGWTDGDLEDAYRSASWRVMLNETDYKKVVGYIRKLQASSPVWHAALYNCNAFVADIARSMGYKTPGPWLRPQQFIIKLREMNGGPNPIGYTGPPG
jgi:hypothetical protein